MLSIGNPVQKSQQSTSGFRIPARHTQVREKTKSPEKPLLEVYGFHLQKSVTDKQYETTIQAIDVVKDRVVTEEVRQEFRNDKIRENQEKKEFYTSIKDRKTQKENLSIIEPKKEETKKKQENEEGKRTQTSKLDYIFEMRRQDQDIIQDAMQKEEEFLKSNFLRSNGFKQNPYYTNEQFETKYKSKFAEFHNSKKLQQKKIYFGGAFENQQDFDRYIQPTNKISQKKLKKNNENLPVLKKDHEKLDFAEQQETKLLQHMFDKMKTNKEVKQIYQDKLAPKIEIVRFLFENPNILDIYEIEQDTLNQQILSYLTENRYHMDFKEFFNFMQRRFQDDYDETDDTCLLSMENIEKIRLVYCSQGKISIQESVEILRQDPSLQDLFHLDAVHDPETDKDYNLDEILQVIVDSTEPEQYLTWEQFHSQFTKLHSNLFKFKVEQIKKQALQNVKYHELILPEKVIDDLCENIVNISLQQDGPEGTIIQNPKFYNYIHTGFLIETIQNLPDYDDIKDLLARTQYKSTPSETVNEVLTRMLEQANAYIDVQEFFDFFSISGIPPHYFEQFEDEVEEDKTPQIQEDEENELVQKLQKVDRVYDELKKIGDSDIQYERMLELPRAFSITVPDPFSFEKRERSLTIRERKLSEMLDETNKSQIFEPFQARDIPKTTTEPLYQQILQKNEMRRKEVKELSKSLTLKNERPFSFYYRDKSKTRVRQKQHDAPIRLHAIPVPESTKSNLYQQILDKERQLSLDKKERWEIISAHKRQQEESQKKEYLRRSKSQYYIPFKRLPIPDFVKLQDEFAKTLEDRKKSQPQTKIEPFNFEISKKKTQLHQTDFQKKKKKRLTSREFKQQMEKIHEKLNQPATFKVGQTKSMKVLKECRQNNNKEKQIQQQQIKKEEDKQKQKYNRMKAKVQSSKYLVDNTEMFEKKRQEIQDKRKEEFKKMKEDHKKEIKQIHEKVDSRPLLFEQSYKKDLKLDKIRGILSFMETMKKNGVKNAKSFLKKDEIKLLDDYQYLQKQGQENINYLGSQSIKQQ